MEYYSYVNPHALGCQYYGRPSFHSLQQIILERRTPTRKKQNSPDEGKTESKVFETEHLNHGECEISNEFWHVCPSSNRALYFVGIVLAVILNPSKADRNNPGVDLVDISVVAEDYFSIYDSGAT